MNNIFFNLKKPISILIASLYSKFMDICVLPMKVIHGKKWVRRIENYYQKNPRMDYFFLVFSILLVSFILFNKFIFGNLVFICNEKDVGMDAIEGLYPYIYYLFHNQEGLSWWSFNSGIGNNMFPIILAFFVDPFAILGALCWDTIENGFIYMHILKLVFTAVFFYKLILILTKNNLI